MVAYWVSSKRYTVKTKPQWGVTKACWSEHKLSYFSVLFDLTLSFTDFFSRATFPSLHEQYYLPFWFTSSTNLGTVYESSNSAT